MTRIQHAGGAVTAKLSSPISNSDSTIACDNLAGWPDGSVGPFYAVIDRGKATEEKIRAAGRSSNTLTGVLRGQDGTSAAAHASLASIDHIFTATEADAANAHIEATSGVHGLAGGIVGLTDTQTLTNKTLTAPVINSPTLAGGTVNPSTLQQGGVPAVTTTGTATLTNKTLTSPAINNAAIAGTSTIAGSVTNSGTIAGGTMNPTTLQQNSVPVVTTSAAQTLTNKTMTAPVLNDPVINSGSGGLSLNTTGIITFPGVIASDTATLNNLTQTVANKTLLTTNHSTGSIGTGVTLGAIGMNELEDLIADAGSSATFSATNVTGASGTVYFKYMGHKFVFLRYHFTGGTVTANGTIGLAIPSPLAAAAAGRQLLPSHGLIDGLFVNAGGTSFTSYGSLTAGANLTGYTAQGIIEVA